MESAVVPRFWRVDWAGLGQPPALRAGYARSSVVSVVGRSPTSPNFLPSLSTLMLVVTVFPQGPDSVEIVF